MEIKEKFSQLATTIGDSLAEKEWFQEGKAKWEELDPAARTQVKLGVSGGIFLIISIWFLAFIWGVYSTKHEIAEKGEILKFIQTADSEVRQLRETNAAALNSAEAAAGSWSDFLIASATKAGLDRANITVSPERLPKDGAVPTTNSASSSKTTSSGSSSPSSSKEPLYKETLYDISVKNASIRQIVRYAFGLENESRPVKLRGLTVDTKGLRTGYMDATISVSAFVLSNTLKNGT